MGSATQVVLLWRHDTRQDRRSVAMPHDDRAGVAPLTAGHLLWECRAYPVMEHYLLPSSTAEEPFPRSGTVAEKVVEVDRGAPAGENILVFLSGKADIIDVVNLLEDACPAAQVLTTLHRIDGWHLAWSFACPYVMWPCLANAVTCRCMSSWMVIMR
jgi:hypothetical protein